MHSCIFFVSSRSTKQLETKLFSSTTKAAMNRPQRFRGLATGPGVQRKAPQAVIRRAGTAVGKTLGMDPYRASSAERSTQDRITDIATPGECVKRLYSRKQGCRSDQHLLNMKIKEFEYVPLRKNRIWNGLSVAGNRSRSAC